MSVVVTGSIDSATQKRISRLLSTPAGSVPFDRAFGVDTSFIDDAPAALEGAMMVAFSRAILEYYPAYTISDISFVVDGSQITPTVVITDV